MSAPWKRERPARHVGAAITTSGKGRYLSSKPYFIIAGQQTPVFYGWDNLPKYLTYIPSVGEMIIVAGAIALCVAGFIAGERLFGRVFNEAGHH